MDSRHSAFVCLALEARAPLEMSKTLIPWTVPQEVRGLLEEVQHHKVRAESAILAADQIQQRDNKWAIPFPV